ncbi:non-homologous end-joining DNA ligase [Rhizobium sp. TH2]|uniref:non-homologous end-joining DNA ligase n=1 Tax=Rhizobium sp. TH2 TaxID=2775403 RepID=UPI00215745E3|nr:non-homologous end-joining DNA ligase [Rhizobium sp. TH2]UVC09138.1 non-homologous end-joining DNA ligase [Rhizobium sp. TH2]
MAKRPIKPTQTIPLLREADLPLSSKPIEPRDPRQPRLPFDPMPDRIEPCLALLSLKVPKGDNWIYEIKWDGYRLAVHVEPTGVRILTRGGHDWTHRFPEIGKAASELGPATMILDGEAVVLDEQGRSDFGALQASLGGRGGKRTSHEAILYAFDLLYFDGHDLTALGLHERRQMLADVIPDQTGQIRLSEAFEGDGETLFAEACKHGLEGIIAKNDDRPYRSGRTGDWIKIKCIQSDTFAIVGYEPSTKVPGAIASLLLAARKAKELVYVGSVGTGWKRSEAVALKRRLDGMRTAAPAIKLKNKKLVFVEPTLAAEVEYRAWTKDAQLRHASFKGLREAAAHAEIYSIDD